jgi:DNA helicase MCM9
MNHKAEQTAESKNKNIKNAAFNIEPSLVSRFDFVFFLEKPEDQNFDESIIDAIINESRTAYKEVFIEWSLEKLQSHVIVAKNIACELTLDAHRLILNYYRFCTACVEVDEARKTMRLLKSLERLTVGHAKLMLRNKTKLIDALTIIWLTENSWSFGDLIERQNVVLSELPVGPSPDCIKHIFDTLQLSHLKDVFDAEQNESSSNTVLQLNTTLKGEAQNKKELKKLFNKTSALKRRSNETKCTEDLTENVDVDAELPEFLKKSFAISSIDDLFANSDDEVDESNKVGQKKQQISSDTLSIQHMEDYLLNEESNDSINNFEVIKDNMSTQNGQMPINDRAVVSQRPTVPILESELKENDETKRIKMSNEDDEFVKEMLKDMPHASKSFTSKNDKQKKPTSLGFLRLKAYEFNSQKTQKDEKKADEGGLTSISANLLALSNQLAENSVQKVPDQKKSSTTMTAEELLKALDDELDLWN